MSEQTKSCPYCAETIKAGAVFCRFCSKDLAPEKAPRSTPKLLSWWIGIPLALSLAGGAYWVAGIQERKAIDVVRQMLKDPDSAVFTSVRKSKDGDWFCGYVNAKNSMGGYVGERPFMSAVSVELAEFDEGERTAGPDFEVMLAKVRREGFLRRFKEACL